MKNFWNSSIKKKLVSHGGVPDLANFPDIPNPNNNASPETFFSSFNGNPNLIPSPQDHHHHHQFYLPSPTSLLQSGTDHGNYNLDFSHFQPFLAPPPLSDPSTYDPTWPLNYHPHLNQEDYVLGNDVCPPHFLETKLINPNFSLPSYINSPPPMASMMPKLSETINGNDHRIMGPSSFPHESVDLLVRLPSFPSGSHPHAPQVPVPISHIDYIDAIMSSLPSS